MRWKAVFTTSNTPPIRANLAKKGAPGALFRRRALFFGGFANAVGGTRLCLLVVSGCCFGVNNPLYFLSEFEYSGLGPFRDVQSPPKPSVLNLQTLMQMILGIACDNLFSWHAGKRGEVRNRIG